MQKPSKKTEGAGAWGVIGSIVGGLAAGAGAAHLLYSRGHKIGFDLRKERPEPLPPSPPTPEDFEAKEPGRGRLAQRPEHIPHKGWVDIFWRVGASYFGDRVGFVAGGVTFFVTLSLFPTLAAFVTLYGLFSDPADAWSRLQFLYSVLPSGVAQFLGGEMQRLAANATTTLTFTLVFTLALSLWTANGAIKVLFYGLNIAYHEVERRSLVRYNLTCMAFTVTGLVSILATAALIVGVPVVLGVFGLADEWAHLAPLRWPVLLVVYIAALTIIYRFGPCRSRARWRWLTPGALFAALLSLALSLAFSWYLQTFVRTAYYGPLAAMMGFLLWTWLSVQIIIMGAELNAEIEHQTAIDTTVGDHRPIGERGAVMADSVGPKRGSPAALAFTLKHAEALSDRLLRRRIRRRSARDAKP
ncbi:MAG: YihY/virulence factor BrkB family protein [Brevundimonas sp.]|uniref:YihY/virulence factor BrkB family protein n=1 Tax=Brevundimonas sp. TaxID=1871086 RepID=UPI00271F24C7|nr:YihY/virulence factor BrkB family protein [Brevundimonas sp.]MDO9587769.1 YihY/virulence factor BrkB family protein [Brevundimonas sp.]MDP3370214.1 YihY/virulence factor BrkB family protein [Brevundimonas sp.]MDP3657970.1 YihY/virulence factor BrkB family protein [Brevundimonas sp.]MDZ4111013.1 YihY/virulence factor BrkB family protein [Brevundimonas sp.]